MRAVLLSTVFLAGLPAYANDLSVYAGASLTFTNGDQGTRRNVEAYVEADLANFYLGATGDIYNDKTSDEVDLSLGYRNKAASGLSYDLSYTRYLYPNDRGDCCGDVDVILSIPFTDALKGTLDLNYYPQDKTSDAHVKLDYKVNDKITLTAKVGVVQNVDAPQTKEWQLAARCQLGNETAVKLQYYDGNDYKGYFGLDLTWDTTVLGG